MVLIQKFEILTCVAYKDRLMGVWASPLETVNKVAREFNLVKFVQPQIQAPPGSYLESWDMFFLVKQYPDFYISNADASQPDKMKEKFVQGRRLALYKLTAVPIANSAENTLSNEVCIREVYTDPDPLLAHRIWLRAEQRRREARRKEAKSAISIPAASPALPLNAPMRRRRPRKASAQEVEQPKTDAL